MINLILRWLSAWEPEYNLRIRLLRGLRMKG